MAVRIGKAALDEFDLRHRSGVEMADAGGPHLLEHMGCRIGLDGIERIAGKTVEESPRRRAELLRKDAIERLAGLERRNRLLDRGKAGNGIDARRCVQAKSHRSVTT